MSIINDALKKVQQSLNTKAEEPPPSAPATTQAPLFAAPPPVETVEDITAPPAAQKPNTMKSLLAMVCATVITAACLALFWYEVQNSFPKAKEWAEVSAAKIRHLTVKTRPTENPKPLAQVTLPLPTAPAAVKSPAPTTLNIQGVMADASGTGGNVALINGQVYKEGDQINGAKILKINLDSIVISNNGVEQTIQVGK